MMKTCHFLIADHAEWGCDQVVSRTWTDHPEREEMNKRIIDEDYAQIVQDGCTNIRIVTNKWKPLMNRFGIIGWDKVSETTKPFKHKKG